MGVLLHRAEARPAGARHSGAEGVVPERVPTGGELAARGKERTVLPDVYDAPRVAARLPTRLELWRGHDPAVDGASTATRTVGS
jgi:hypothetical protein